jgi:hypothetical protein
MVSGAKEFLVTSKVRKSLSPARITVRETTVPSSPESLATAF